MTTLGRNDKCTCGSGKKYKQCCMQRVASGDISRGSAMTPSQVNNVVQALRSATAHHQAGRLDEAEAIYRQILQRAPRHPEVLYLRGLIAYQTGKLEIAFDLINQAIAVDPSNPAYYNLLGSVFNGQGRLAEAISNHRKAISLKPDFAEAHCNLGSEYRKLGELDDAVASYNKAISFKPDYAKAYLLLGSVLQEQNNNIGAVAIYKKVISLQPDYAEAYCDLGVAFFNLGKMEEAVASYRKAIALKPDYFFAYNNLGNAYLSLTNIDEAVGCYCQALAIKPDFSDAYSNYLLSINYSLRYTQTDVFAAHRAFAEQFEAPLRRNWPLHKNLCDRERRLKVGFVSGDFRTHPVAVFIEALLAHLDRNKLEVVLYYNHTLIDDVTLRLKSLGYLWRSLVGVTDDDAARMILDDGIDILIDLSGHTRLNRLQLFVRKPAPVQVTYLGYFATTGLQSIDYILGDTYVLPSEEADHYVERPWCLPESYLCFTPPQDDVKIEELPAIRNGFITFGSFNNLAKLDDAVVALWTRILQAVPDSRLFLYTQILNDLTVRNALVKRFTDLGIDKKRLIFEGWSSKSDHFTAYNRMDVALDPFPFSGVTTSVDALWMGVPVLHLHGDRFISHAGESILINVGLSEWIAADADDYVRLAAQLTGNLPQLAKVRAGLRAQLLASPLCDAPRFARNFETALRGMWQQWCSQTPST